MNDYLEYKGYYASIKYSADNGGYLYGRLEGINDSVLFDSTEAGGNAVTAFRNAVDDYLEFCKEQGKEPEKPYKGKFNVRISSDLHRRAAFKAAEKRISLNRVVEESLEAYISGS